MTNISEGPRSQDTLKALWKITKIVLDNLNFDEVTQKITDSLLEELGYLNLGYRIIVLALYNEQKNGLQRTALSRTPQAAAAIAVSSIPFHDIVIPLTKVENYCVRAYLDKKPYVTHDFKDILSPPLTPEDARTNQKAAGIKTSMVFPIIVKDRSVGVVIFSMVKDQSEVSEFEKDMIRGFIDIIGIAVQNAKLYSDLEYTTHQLHEANEKLKQLDRMKDEFISLASHELRAPLSSMKAAVSTILEGYAGNVDAKTKEFLTAAFNENDRLIRLVNNLLNISRIRAGRFEFTFKQTNIETIIADVVKSFQFAVAEKKLALEYKKYEQKLPEIFADKDKLREVVINLISNALKFTDQGGITITAQLKDNEIIVSVADSGSGIPKKDQAKLFERFSQAEQPLNKKAKGTGLGLYLSRKIVERHGGKIWFESVEGKGTTFYFTIPIKN